MYNKPMLPSPLHKPLFVLRIQSSMLAADYVRPAYKAHYTVRHDDCETEKTDAEDM